MDKNIIEKIANTLNKIGSKFGSADLLASIIRKYGLFNGIMCYNTDPNDDEEWYLYKDDADRTYAWANQGWDRPEFGAILDEENDKWYCSVGFGVHGLDLTFDTKTGELIDIIPDDVPSNWCWDSDVIEDRVKQIQRYLSR